MFSYVKNLQKLLLAFCVTRSACVFGVRAMLTGIQGYSRVSFISTDVGRFTKYIRLTKAEIFLFHFYDCAYVSVLSTRNNFAVLFCEFCGRESYEYAPHCLFLLV